LPIEHFLSLLLVAGCLPEYDLVQLLIKPFVLIVEISCDIIETPDLLLQPLNVIIHNASFFVESPDLIVFSYA